MKNAFYFRYGGKGFGEVMELGKTFKANFSSDEGAGVALRKGYELNEFPEEIILNVTNLNSKEVTIRVEKKPTSPQQFEKYQLPPLATKRIAVKLSSEERKSLTEVVVAILREDNTYKKINIQVDANIKE